jgi:hypothetical protein
MGEPHTPQKLRVTGPFSKRLSASERSVTSSALKPTKAETGAPVARRQSAQWQ